MIIKGKSKDLLEDSLSNALIAVEIYNKPKFEGRLKSYIIHMIIAWTKLFHAYYYRNIGEKYFYKDKKGRYIIIDGEKKTWELNMCIKKYKKISEAVRVNLEFFIKLRNKIEHSFLNCTDLEIKIFGECQSLLYNYEQFIIEHFGREYCLNVCLPFSLQFSELRNEISYKSSKKLLSKEMQKINEFVDKFRDNIPIDVYNEQEYSVKLVQIPLVSNTNKGDLAIQFLNWKNLNEEQKEMVDKLTVIVKDNPIMKEVSNISKKMPGEIVKIIKEKEFNFNQNLHTALLYIFSIRPSKKFESNIDPFETNTEYCYYDQAHKDYQYTDKWIAFLENIFINNKLSINDIKSKYKNKEKLYIEDYE